MSSNSLEQRVSKELEKRGHRVRNLAALGALVKIIPVIGESLHHALTAGEDALQDEKHKIQMALLCDLAEKIDRGVSELLEAATSRGAPFVEVSGRIHVTGERSTNVTGLEISTDRSAVIKPGTVVTVQGADAVNITGVKI